MSSGRFQIAIENAGFPLDVDVVVYRPPVDVDLSPLDPAKTLIVHGFRPAAAIWETRGFRVEPRAHGVFSAAIVFAGRYKDQARALIAEAASLVQGGPILIDGQKTDGIDSLYKDLRARVDVGGTVTKAHGRAFWMTGDAQAVADWRKQPEQTPAGFVTAPGVFSADGPDPASVYLTEALPPLAGRVADLGAGWGFLSHHVLHGGQVQQADLIEAEYDALECARMNVTDPRARFIWDDATTFAGEGAYDAIICNPPFHTSRAADPAIGQGFVVAAARLLAPGGEFWMVANRHLPYERTLSEYFRDVSEIAINEKFKVFRARRPVKQGRRGR